MVKVFNSLVGSLTNRGLHVVKVFNSLVGSLTNRVLNRWHTM